ncbi:MAG: glycosyltransferase family 39 protein [Ignavibacteria bacterium]|nr:glycosyltransferase family 39 protein [Ignavibacteria bacterium]
MMAFAAAVRAYGLGARDLWLDEAYSLRFARVPMAAFFETIAHADQHPPLYYLLLHGTIAVFGQSEAALRFPSLLLSVLTLPAVYLIARRAAGPRGALLAALLFAVSAVHVRYAQEARMYALQSFGIAWSLVGLLSALLAETPDRSARHLIWWDRAMAGRWAGWMLYSFGALVALYSQNTTLLYIACTAGAVLFLAVAGRVPRAATIAGLGLSLFLVATGWLPWAPSFAAQAGQVTTQFWIPRPDVAAVVRTVEALLMPFPGLTNPAIRGALLLVLVALLLAGLRGRGRELRLTVPLGAVVLLAPLALLLMSLRTPLFIPRALLWTTLPFFACAARGALSIPGSALRVSAVLLLVAASLASTAAYHTTWEKEQWRGAAAYVASRAADGDTVFVHSASVGLPFRYYFGQRAQRVHVEEIPAFSLTGAWEPRFGPEEESLLARRTAGGGEVWLVYSHFEYSDPARRMTALLDSLYPRHELRRFTGIEVWRFAR